VYVATWGKEGLSPRTRKAAFDHIDLKQGLANFVQTTEPAAAKRPAEPGPAAPVGPLVREGQAGPPPSGGGEGGDTEAGFLQALASAEKSFQAGYVGANYFLRTWKSRLVPTGFQARNRILQKLLGKGKVESYDAPDGNKALRIRMGTSGPAQGDAAGAEA